MAQKQEQLDKVATKLTFRHFLKEKFNNMSVSDMKMQEIYNRYFFFRKEEIESQKIVETTPKHNLSVSGPK